MQRHPHLDANQTSIVKALRMIPGVSVQSLASLGDGAPDIAVGYRRRTYLYEIKSEKGALTPDQKAWHAKWRGHVAIARNLDGILLDMGLTSGGKA